MCDVNKQNFKTEGMNLSSDLMSFSTFTITTNALNFYSQTQED